LKPSSTQRSAKPSPNPHHRQTYTRVDEMLASPDKPMPEASQRSQVARMWEGLRNIESAPEPTRYDWSVVFDALRLMEALIEQKTWKMADGSMADVVDTNGLLEDAITGVAIAGARHMQDGKTIRLDARYIAGDKPPQVGLD
jgi:hypothetical protein